MSSYLKVSGYECFLFFLPPFSLILSKNYVMNKNVLILSNQNISITFFFPQIFSSWKWAGRVLILYMLLILNCRLWIQKSFSCPALVITVVTASKSRAPEAFLCLPVVLCLFQSNTKHFTSFRARQRHFLRWENTSPLVQLRRGTEDFPLLNLKEWKALMYFLCDNEKHSSTDVGRNIKLEQFSSK